MCDVDDEMMFVRCKDGELMFPREAYEDSVLIRDLVDRQQKWIAEHSIQEVKDEIEELYYK